jgi:hypothetical protein
MHPLLNRRSYLGTYLVVWVQLGGLLVFMVKVSGGFTSLQAVVLVVPLAVVFAAACSSAWYTCRATPLSTSGIGRVSLHGVAALLLSFAWAQLGRAYAHVLATSPFFAGLDARYEAHADVLFVCGVFTDLLNVGFTTSSSPWKPHVSPKPACERPASWPATPS